MNGQHRKKLQASSKKAKYVYLLALLMLSSILSFSQKMVSITIDDVPRPSSELLDIIDSLQIPATIFINEHKLFHEGRLDSNQLKSLQDWFKHPLIMPGNHTFQHSRYSKVGFANFTTDIKKGEIYTRENLPVSKELRYFRFPYNDLGKDSLQQDSILTFLASNGYYSTPFTIESADWMFNSLYVHLLKKGQIKEAKETAASYLNLTLQISQHMDSLSNAIYGRSIPQIYLCHDNQLNQDVLPQLISIFQKDGYRVSSLDECLEDAIYQSENFYHKKYGVSWIYRWMENPKERMRMMRSEPILDPVFEKRYQLMKEEKK